MINVSVTAYGPLFNGKLLNALDQAIDEAEENIATEGANHLKGDLGVPPFKSPTGWYASHITQKRLGSRWVIWDTGVIYGPWLAGTGSRNYPVTRFRGYRHWQRLIAYVNRIAKPETEKVVARAIARAGG